MKRALGVSLGERLSRMTDRRFKAGVYLTALGLYLIGIWLHLPYGGGHVYTDLTQLFQDRLWVCPSPSYYQYDACALSVPYLQSFNEYPVLTSMFMYVMAVFGAFLPWYLPENYYLLSAAVLVVPTVLAIRELMKIIELRGASRSRVLLY